MPTTLHHVERPREAAPEFLGLPFWTEDSTALIEHIRKRVCGQELIEILSLNAEISMQVRDEPAYRELMAKNPTNIIDGEGVRRMLALKYGHHFERISGSDFIFNLAALATVEGWDIFLLGASEDVSEKAASRLAQMNPGLNIERYSPPFESTPEGQPTLRVSKELSHEILARIASARPTILVSCLGAPKQDLWPREHHLELVACGVRISLSAGGALDFLAGKVHRAPKAISNIGLEWAWRLALEPQARFGRMVKRLPRFLAHGLADALSHRLRRTSQP